MLKMPKTSSKPQLKLLKSQKTSFWAGFKRMPLKMKIGVVLLGLVVLVSALVLINLNKSQEDRSQASGKKAEECDKDQVSKVNQKGNIVCVDKPKKDEIGGKTGCKGGQIEVRDPDGNNICMDKCKSGYTLGTDRGTGKFGCTKTSNCPSGLRYAQNAKGVWSCQCPEGSSFNSKDKCIANH